MLLNLFCILWIISNIRFYSIFPRIINRSCNIINFSLWLVFYRIILLILIIWFILINFFLYNLFVLYLVWL